MGGVFCQAGSVKERRVPPYVLESVSGGRKMVRHCQNAVCWLVG